METALAAQQKLREGHARFTRTSPRTLTPAERQTITALASDIDGLWHAETTTVRDRKEIVRSIVDEVVITVIGTTERVKARIVWASGATNRDELVRPVQCLEQTGYYPQLAARIRELAGQGRRSTGIAHRLAAEGFRSAKGGRQIAQGTVHELMRHLGCESARVHPRRPAPPGDEPGPNEWWLDQLAAELGMPKATLHSWIRSGWLTVRKASRHPYRITVCADQAELAELRERRTRPPGWYSRHLWSDSVDELGNPHS